VALHKDGSEFPVEFSLSSIETQEGMMATAAIRDITFRKKADEELIKHRDHLEELIAERTEELQDEIEERKKTDKQLWEKNKELKDFTHTVSHDLKAPLRGIYGYAQELERSHRDQLSDRGQHCTQEIISSASELDRLIEALLHYSSLESETIKKVEVEVGAMLDSVLRETWDVQGNGAQIETDISFSIIWCWHLGLYQVLSNLIDNAIKYSSEKHQPEIKIKGEETATSYRFSISDNGVGFDMKSHDRIFQLFQRLKSIDGIKGTGAGLAIVKKLVEKQDGKVWAESQPGKGATFFVELPKSKVRSK